MSSKMTYLLTSSRRSDELYSTTAKTRDTVFRYMYDVLHIYIYIYITLSACNITVYAIRTRNIT